MKANSYTTLPGMANPSSTTVGIYTAACIALRYRVTPTPKQLMTDFDMSHATAYRWVSAFKLARGEA